MADSTGLLARLLALLEDVPLTVYVGHVPDTVPADSAGYARPYVAIFPPVGRPPSAARAASGYTSGELDWKPATTVAAGDPSQCLQAARMVTSALDEQFVGAGILRRDPSDVPMQFDPAVKPGRHYLPISWQLITT